MNATDRNLTEADVEAILDAFESRFYKNLGKGFWNVVWRTAVVVLIAIASWGQIKGHSL